MYLDKDESLYLAKSYKADFKNSKVQLIVAPNFAYFEEVAKVFKRTKIKLAGQNVSYLEKGALT